MYQRFALIFLLVPVMNGTLTTDSYHLTEDNNRVVGGRPAFVNEFPYQVAFLTRGADHAFCGGSIIGHRWILTAAHCFYDDDKLDRNMGKIDIVVGTTNLNEPHDVLKIEKLFLRGYDPQSSRNDIALVKTRTPIITDTGRGIQDILPALRPDRKNSKSDHKQAPKPIEMAKPGHELFDWTMATITGFGNVNENGKSSANLLAADINVMPDSKCAIVYPEYRADMMMCAGRLNSESDTCQGDSGGPLALSVVKKPILVGITSFGEGCAKRGYPGVYTRVTYFYDWITRTMSDN
jgi:kallikrein